MLWNSLSGLLQSPGRRKVIENFSWLFFDKILSLFDAFFIGALVARHLGPGDIGLLAYAMAILSMATVVASLGFDSVFTRELIKHPDQRSTIVWSLGFARLISATVIFSIICFASWQGLLGQAKPQEKLATVIISTGLLMAPLALCRLMLDAQLLAKWAVWVTNIVLVLAAIAKLILLYFSASVLAFAVVYAATSTITSILLFLIVKRLDILPKYCRPDRSTIYQYLKECWPLLITGLSIGLYMNIDIVMLANISGEKAAGIYSVATKLSSVWYFMPMLLASSLFPALTRLHVQDETKYRQRFQWFLDINTISSYVAVMIALLVFPTLLFVLYGPKFAASIPVFQIHIWALPFVFHGVARAQHLTLESMHRFSMIATLAGMVANVAMNLLMIPAFGPSGAAIATVISFAIAGFGTSFISSQVRPIGYEQALSFVFSPLRLYRAAIA